MPERTVDMTRSEMTAKIMQAAVDASGVATTDPVYLAAKRELHAHTDAELRVLCRGIDTGEIYEAAARAAG